MQDRRLANILATFALVMTDRIGAATDAAAGAGAMVPAALIQIGSNPGVTIEALRIALALSQPATSRLIDRLAERGLLTRQRVAADARHVALQLSADGQRLYDQILAARYETVAQALDGLSAAQRDQLIHAVEAMLRRLIATEAESEQACRLCDLAACPAEICPAGSEPSGHD